MDRLSFAEHVQGTRDQRGAGCALRIGTAATGRYSARVTYRRRSAHCGSGYVAGSTLWTGDDDDERGRGMAVIQVVVGVAGPLVRGALAAVLGHEEDIEVIAELADADEVFRTAERCSPQVVVLDMDLLETEQTSTAQELLSTMPDTRLLLLVDTQKPSAVGRVRISDVPRMGFVAMGASPARLMEAIREIARGEAVLEPEVTVAALTAVQNPLTSREREILAIAAEGVPVKEIADRLYLAVGTVRNNLSRILAKTGARTRIEAVKIAQDAGWL
jgi:two-component system, NarL family, response regulator DesR